MPPRGKTEGLVTDIPDQPPSLYDEKLIEQVLQLLSDGDEASLMSLVAMSVGADKYVVDLRQQIVLDSRLDFFRFCGSQKYNPHKIVHLLKWMTHFQETIVEKGCGMEEMRAEVIKFATSEIEERWNSKNAPPADESAAEAPPPKASVKKGTRAAEKAAQEEAEAAPAYPREQTYLSKEEIGPFCTYLLHGIIRHAALYAHVATHPRVPKPSTEFTYFLEMPVPPPPLRFASAPTPDPMRAMVEKMRGRQADELEIMTGAFEEAVMRENIRKTMEQAEKDMNILFDREGTKRAVEDTFGSLENDLSEQQRRILTRIAAIERKLGADNVSRTA